MSIAVLDQMTTQETLVVHKALMRASENLEINRAKLALVLGLSAPSVTRLFQGQFQFGIASKEYEHALLFLRMYSALMALAQERQLAIAWLRAENLGVGQKPIELMLSTEGLVRVVGYLESTNAQ